MYTNNIFLSNNAFRIFDNSIYYIHIPLWEVGNLNRRR